MSAKVERANGRTPRDAELEQAAHEALLRYGTLRIWGHALQISASSGVVTCEGHVRTTSSKDTAERLIRQVPGVRQVVSHLFVDTDLEVAAAQALAKDPRTVNSFPGILVGSAFGEVILKGNVSSEETKKAAAEIVAKVPGVRSVTNELVAPEAPKPAIPAKPAPKPASTRTEPQSQVPAPNPGPGGEGELPAVSRGGSQGKPAEEEGESSEE